MSAFVRIAGAGVEIPCDSSRPEEDCPDRRVSGCLDPSTMTNSTAVLPKSFRSIARQRQMLGEECDDHFLVALRDGRMDMDTVLMGL